jgi:hypothetical protein
MYFELDDRGSIPSRKKKFSLLHSVQTGCRAHTASYLLGNVVKRQGRETDHSLSSNVEAKNGGDIPPLLPINLWRRA